MFVDPPSLNRVRYLNALASRDWNQILSAFILSSVEYISAKSYIHFWQKCNFSVLCVILPRHFAVFTGLTMSYTRHRIETIKSARIYTPRIRAVRLIIEFAVASRRKKFSLITLTLFYAAIFRRICSFKYKYASSFDMTFLINIKSWILKNLLIYI